MENATVWHVDQYVLVGLTLAFFAFIGLRRGINRELLSMVGIGLGILLANILASSLAPHVNRFYRLGRFALGGGLASEDPASAWQEVKGLPDLVSTPGDEPLLSVLVFGITALFFYLWGQIRVPPAYSWSSRVLGMLAGGVNGFLVAYYLFPLLLPDSSAVITVSSGDVSSALSNSQTVALAAVFFVIVLIAFGLSSSRSRSDDLQNRE